VSQLCHEPSQCSKVSLYGQTDRWKVRSGCGVAGDETRSAILLDETSVLGTNGSLLVQDAETGSAPEQHDHSRVDDVDLVMPMDAALSDVCRGRFASRSAVFDRAGEIHGVLVQPQAPDCTAEPLARLSDERPSRFGLLPTRSFTDEDNPSASCLPPRWRLAA
jgi:hypothetical protein